jgi:hypothetical protein
MLSQWGVSGDKNMRNVEWSEDSGASNARVYASDAGDGWSFWRKEGRWDLWRRMTSTEDLRNRAEDEFRALIAKIEECRGACPDWGDDSELMPVMS